jgi:DNA-binding response OmpR family regulator
VPKPIELLLVEDSAGDIMLIRQVLSREPVPISIRVAVNGNQAMEILDGHEFTPDLVILDLNIPQPSGFAVLQDIQREVPVVVFTSSSDPQDRVRSFDLGVKDYVRKPIDLDEYSTEVSRMFRNWSKRAVPSLE